MRGQKLLAGIAAIGASVLAAGCATPTTTSGEPNWPASSGTTTTSSESDGSTAFARTTATCPSTDAKRPGAIRPEVTKTEPRELERKAGKRGDTSSPPR